MNPYLKHQVDLLVGAARVNLEKSGHLVPVAIIHHPPNNVKVVPCSFRNDEEKDFVAGELRHMARELEATKVIFIHEAWLRRQANAQSIDEWDGVLPSESPDKKEVVAVLVETLDGCYMGYAPITRDTGRPTFGEIDYHPMGERSERERFRFL